MENIKMLSKIKNGNLFDVADIEFIKFKEENGYTFAIAKDSLFESKFGDNNNFADSVPKRRLEEEILPKLEKAVGAENIIEHEVDLLSLDGSNEYGKIKTKISLPTFDFCREHSDILHKYKTNRYFWLSTPWSTPKYEDDIFVLCVSPSGYFDNDDCCYDFIGVRPFIIFASSISVISVSREDR